MPRTVKELYHEAVRYGHRNTFWYLVSALALPSRFGEWTTIECNVMENALAKDVEQAKRLEREYQERIDNATIRK